MINSNTKPDQPIAARELAPGMQIEHFVTGVGHEFSKINSVAWTPKGVQVDCGHDLRMLYSPEQLVVVRPGDLDTKTDSNTNGQASRDGQPDRMSYTSLFAGALLAATLSDALDANVVIVAVGGDDPDTNTTTTEKDG